MNMIRLLSTVLLFCLSATTPYAQDNLVDEDFGLNDTPTKPSEPQKVLFDGAPIELVLTAGVERRIIFDSSFDVILDPNTPNDHLDAFNPQIFGKNLLLTISTPLSMRAIAKVGDGEEIPIDIRAVEDAGSNNPIAIVRQSFLEQEKQIEQVLAPPKVPANALHVQQARKLPGYIDLVRFAAQHLYAPERYRDKIGGAVSVGINSRPVRLMRFKLATTTPIAAWKIGQLYVSAIEVKNNQQSALGLDPRLIVGTWRAASFHHNRIGPANSNYGQTMLYLVSDKPFKEALGIYAQVSN